MPPAGRILVAALIIFECFAFFRAGMYFGEAKESRRRRLKGGAND